MVISVYLVLKFLSGLKGFKREWKKSETISTLAVPAHQKQDANIEKGSEIV
jgi:hypothetical protein